MSETIQETNIKLYDQNEILSIMNEFCKDFYSYRNFEIPSYVQTFFKINGMILRDNLLNRYTLVNEQPVFFETKFQIGCFLTGAFVCIQLIKNKSLLINDCFEFIKKLNFATKAPDFDELEESFLRTYKTFISEETPHSLHIKILNTVYSFSVEYRMWNFDKSIQEKQGEEFSLASFRAGAIYVLNNTEGVKKMKRNFNEWFKTFRTSIATYNYYVDFEKVYSNVDAIKVELNILNSLIGSKNIEVDFVNLLKKYPETLKVIPILIAKRESEIYCQDENGGKTFEFDFGRYLPIFHNSFEEYKYFMRETGLFDLLENHIINNLVDYVTGVEVGLDSNGRKSRSGDIMEDLVESYIVKAGFIKGVTYFKEMRLSTIEEKWGLDLSSISNTGKTEKRFDFVVIANNTVHAIETTFYNSSGSKPNETARSYETIALGSKNIDRFKFVWFTDGKGWIPSRHNLEETFDVMEHIYNINDLENGIISEVFV